MHQVKLNENEKYSLATFIISNDKNPIYDFSFI